MGMLNIYHFPVCGGILEHEEKDNEALEKEEKNNEVT